MNPNLIIALGQVSLPVALIWVLTRFKNWGKLPIIPRSTSIIVTAWLCSSAWGNYLRAIHDRSQSWDAVTAILVAVSTCAVIVGAESSARALRAALDSQRREQLLSRIFAGLPPNIVIALCEGRDLRYAEVSRSFADLYGFTPSRGASHLDLFPDSRDPETGWPERFERLLYNGQSSLQEDPIAYTRADGNEGWLSFSLSPIARQSRRTAQGEPAWDALLILRDVSENQRLQREMSEQANRCSLTGLHNKRFYDEAIATLFSRRDRRGDGGPISLILIDLDEFKPINDRYGHLAGDAVLIEMGNRLAAAVRSAELVVRWGGDEFVVVLLADAVAAAKAALRLHDAIISDPVPYRDVALRIRCTMGVATSSPSINTPDLLWAAADEALYAGKASGRNRVRASQSVEMLLRLEDEIRLAVAEERIRPSFQPIFSLQSGELIGAEALARWHRNGTIEPPAVFLQIIEDHPALCQQFCDLQLRLVCQQIKAWSDRWKGWISFNLSQESLKRPEPATWLHGAFDAAGIDSRRIAIEATEQLQQVGPELRQNLALLDASFQQLIHGDLSILLDDFGGAGGGSGTQLSWMIMALAPGANSRLLVKLDKAIVSGIDSNHPKKVLTQGLISTFHGLGFLVVAEGIETQAEADLLRDLGADFGQGWWRGAAVSPAEFEQRWLSIEGINP